MPHDDRDEVTKRNARAWDLVATKYAPDVGADVALLRDGGTSLFPAEVTTLAPLLRDGGRAVHLQCSHGLDTLSLWRLGASAVVGLDVSARMLLLAKQKGELLNAPATWVEADVLAPPSELTATADVLYTGKGALPWILDLERWASVVSRLLVPAGRMFLFEGHPLNWVWDTEAADVGMRADAGYFDSSLRPNVDFPGGYLERFARTSAESSPQALERQWTLGQIVSALVGAGLELEHLREYPEHFWPQFPAVPVSQLARLPHTFSILMRRPAA